MASFPTLSTRRLILRELTREDTAGILALYSSGEVTRFCEMPILRSSQEAEKVLEIFRQYFERGTGVRWALSLKDSSQLIGTCGINWYPHNHSALLSYDLNQACWNHGFMTEAVTAVSAHVFEQGLNRITATTVLENAPSVRVLRKLGFKEEGVLRDWAYWKGEFKDLRCFSLLRAEHSEHANCTRDGNRQDTALLPAGLDLGTRERQPKHSAAR